jgi:hypothetical protein
MRDIGRAADGLPNHHAQIRLSRRSGDVLFEIDPEPYRLRVELASAELQSA